MAHYLDTSALVKLVVAEPENPALSDWLAANDVDAAACDLVRTELMRASRRLDPASTVRVRAVLGAVTLTEVTTAIFEAAGRLEPSGLRSLDAVHLAAALDLGDDLDALVCYDDRLIEAAAANGITVIAPR